MIYTQQKHHFMVCNCTIKNGIPWLLGKYTFNSRVLKLNGYQTSNECFISRHYIYKKSFLRTIFTWFDIFYCFYFKKWETMVPKDISRRHLKKFFQYKTFKMVCTLILQFYFYTSLANYPWRPKIQRTLFNRRKFNKLFLESTKNSKRDV